MSNWKVIAGLVVGLAVSTAGYAQQNAAKPLSAQDLAEIQQLYARYAWAVDTHAEEGMAFAKAFTADGEFQNGKNVTVGRAKLAEFMRKAGPYTPGHFIMNTAFEPTAQGARGRAYLLLVGAAEPNKPASTTPATYEDVLVKTPEGWLFKKRTLFIGTMPPAAPSASN